MCVALIEENNDTHVQQMDPCSKVCVHFMLGRGHLCDWQYLPAGAMATVAAKRERHLNLKTQLFISVVRLCSHHAGILKRLFRETQTSALADAAEVKPS